MRMTSRNILLTFAAMSLATRANAQECNPADFLKNENVTYYKNSELGLSIFDTSEKMDNNEAKTKAGIDFSIYGVPVSLSYDDARKASNYSDQRPSNCDRSIAVFA
jgi:hypothetical protein